MGCTSLMVTLSAWIWNDYSKDNDENYKYSGLPLVLTLLSVLTTTILSIHSSWRMMEQSPHQSTILDWNLELRSVFSFLGTTKEKQQISNHRIRVVAPHRGAFHRTSIIMQYANARILLLLHRKHWMMNDGSYTLSGVFSWGLTTLMCLRMLLGERLLSLGSWLTGYNKAQPAAKRPTKIPKPSTTTSTSTLKPLPPFWKNGNSYCFVLPMIVSVCADFAMTIWCEQRYFHVTNHSSTSLYHYFSDHWLSLWHLLFLQVVAHAIAFSFTLAFRIKHSSKNKQHASSSKATAWMKKACNIKTLYWVCTIGVYLLIAIGIVKAKRTLYELW